ncbi:ATP-binding protein [Paenibacillus phocaensis]|uniref:ATP-binding protein n=1 Tax=Paenibacillus phocaensis TaxID=1776378 RepID=UPI000839BD38|nr:ATP-binding protein [Paenibacillus phocaensis]
MIKNRNRNIFMILLGVGVIAFLALYYTGQANISRSHNPKVQQGVIDLTGWDFTKDGSVKLQGSWEFYWDQLLSSGMEGKLTGYMDVPGQWNKRHFPVFGTATYRLVIKVNPSSMMYGIRISNVQMASAVYVDGVKLGHSGRPAMTREAYVPENAPYTFYFPIHGNTAEITLQAANFDFINGGITNNIHFGSMKSIGNLDRTITGMDIVVVVALGMVGLYHLGVFLKRRQDQSLLYFGAYCIVAGFSFMSLSERLFTQLFYTLPFELSHKLQLAAIYGSMIIITLFIKTICSGLFPAWFFRIVFMLFGSFILFGLIYPFYTYSHLTFIFSTLQVLVYLVVVWKLSVSKEESYGNFSRQSIIILILAFYSLLICLIDNSFYVLGQLPNNYLGIVSMMLFAILISLMLSFRFSDAYRTIELMSLRLLESDRLKDEFLIRTSHELQTPLNGILNISQSMLEGAPDPVHASDKQRMNLMVIQEMARRLSSLVGDILDMERIKRNDLPLHLTAVDLKVTVSIVLEVLDYLASGKEIEIMNRIPNGLPPIYADENRLSQVLMNLIENAIKYTERGRIEIRAEQAADQIKVVVEDTGIGIDPFDWQRIFEPFTQANGERAQGYGGVGLGLSISSRLVQMMKGRLFIEESTPGRGTRMAFTLPGARESKELSANMRMSRRQGALVQDYARTEAANSKSPGPLGFTLLAVDDEPANLQVLQNLFPRGKYNLLTATHGRQALRLLEENPDIDLVLLDVMMPQLSGYEICREIRSRYTLFDLPVVMLTVRNTPQDIAAGFAAGANDFIAKPFHTLEVKARVKTLLELRRSVREALDAETAFLHSQIKPHFLFNALNAILSVGYTDSHRAAQLINHLSQYLRSSFDFSSHDRFVSIRDELKLVKSYVEIEKARFDERLEVEYDIDETLLESRILPLTIQPLVENAIRHGIMQRKQGGKLQLIIRKGTPHSLASSNPAEKMISVEIRDNGIGMSEKKIAELLDLHQYRAKRGVGLMNVHRRLLLFYREGLRIESLDGEWTSVQFQYRASTSSESVS